MAKERNYAAFWGILKKMPGAEKEDIIRQYTGGRTTSLKEMTDKEYQRMIGALNQRGVDKDKLSSARSVALYQLMIYGVDTSNWDEINRFVKQPRIAGKRFAQLGISDLVGLTRKMRAIIDKGERKATQEAIDNFNRGIIASSIHHQLKN